MTAEDQQKLATIRKWMTEIADVTTRNEQQGLALDAMGLQKAIYNLCSSVHELARIIEEV
jgi:hypothetical protein